MTEEWLTIAEISQHAGLPESTARRYSSHFSDWLPSRTIGRVKKYKPEVIHILNHISDLYQQGLSTLEVKEKLQEEIPVTVTVEEEPEQEKESDHHLPTTLPPSALMAIMAAQVQLAQQMTEELKNLRQEVAQLQDEQRQNIIKHSEKVVVELRRDMKQQLVVVQQELAITKALLENQELERKKVETARDKFAKERDIKLIEEMRGLLKDRQSSPWWKKLLGR